jgi:hypothetical protein
MDDTGLADTLKGLAELPGTQPASGSGPGGEDLGQRVRASLGNPTEFQKMTLELQQLPRSDLLDFAKGFLGYSVSSGKEAMSRITARHNNLMQFEARRRFMAGRSAG